jgi:lycopene cyclase domain-containing protein
MHWLYFILNIGSFAIPFAFSFGSKVSFYKKWKFLIPTIAIVGSCFIGWDYIFAKSGIWEFNDQYILGIHVLNLPVEECLFFFFIPYSSVFIYEALKYYYPKHLKKNYGSKVALLVAIMMIITATLNTNRLYTAVTFSLLAVLLLIVVYIIRANYLSHFFFSYLVTLIPFSIVNGFLTAMPVVIYNNSENLDLQIGSIPVEDFFYWMLLLLSNIVLFEYFQTNRKGKNNTT